MEVEENECLNISIDGFFCLLRAAHYIFGVIVGVSGEHNKGVRFLLDTRAGLNLIRIDTLPYGWENKVYEGVTQPRLFYANLKPFDLCEVVWIMKRFRI